MKTIFINILAFGILLSSIFSITSKNPIISVIFLISAFVQAALYLIIIGIKFIGISYIIIYVGAIAVLFLFILMMINVKLTDILETGSQYTKNLPLGIAIGSLFIFIIFSIIPYNINDVPVIYMLLNNVTILNNFISNTNIQSMNLVNFLTNYNLFPLLSDVIMSDFQQIEILGYDIYTYGAFLLIILSVILLLAMFSTIILSKSIKNT
jgi:NADH-ubiquinone oxidoreductase chain 6